jgi:hypothetical protein
VSDEIKEYSTGYCHSEITNGTVDVIKFDTKEYICNKCNKTSSIIGLQITIIPGNYENFCVHCFADLIRNTCGNLTEVKL